MQTIGLLGGMTWHSTLEYYRLFNELINRKKGNQNAAKVLIYSFNFQELRNWQMESPEFLAKQLALQAKKLEKAGADILLIGANTMHEYYDRVQKELNIPLLHITDAVGQSIVDSGIKKVLLLGTKYTMQGSFYKNKLADYGIDTIVPEKDEQKTVNDIIYNELTKGKIYDKSRLSYLKIIDRIKAEKNIEGIILGCTEIPLLIKQEHIELKVFNSTEIHALSAVNFVLDDN